jgi:hypothetical protein
MVALFHKVMFEFTFVFDPEWPNSFPQPFMQVPTSKSHPNLILNVVMAEIFNIEATPKG